MEITDDRNGLRITKSKRFCAIKGDNMISSIGAPLQTLGAPNTPLWIVHSGEIHPRVKDLQRPRRGKPRRGLQIFDTRVDFPVPAQSRGRFL